ncbi:MAG: tetratricopeptide repeat protein, partial [Ignavibacteriaceae bacterium]
FLTANPQKSWELFQKAVKLVDRTTECEKLYILANNYRRHDNPSKAVEMLEKLIGRYPHEIRAYELLAYSYKNQMLLPHKGAEALELGIKTNPSAKHLMNNLAYFYVFLDQKQKALDMVNQYIKMAPAEPNPYDTKGDIYSIFLQHDSSIASYRKAFELRSDFANGLGFSAVANSQYKEAQRYFEITRYKYPIIEIHKGQILKAINKLKGIMDSQKDTLGVFYRIIPLYYETGQYKEMMHISNELSIMLNKDPGDKFYGRTYIAWSLIKNGKSEEADKLIQELKISTQNTPMQKVIINYLTAVISYEKGDFNSALNKFTEVFEAIPPKHWPSIYFAVTLLKTGKVSASIDLLKQIVEWPPYYGISILFFIPGNFEYWPIPTVKAHYWLGVAYEKKGRVQNAIDEYKKFTDIWKNADFDSPELNNAKKRIVKLTGQNNTDISQKQ